MQKLLDTVHNELKEESARLDIYCTWFAYSGGLNPEHLTSSSQVLCAMYHTQLLSLPPSFPPSLPPSFPPSFPPSLSLSFPLSPSPPLSISPPLSLPPSLPPSLPLCLSVRLSQFLLLLGRFLTSTESCWLFMQDACFCVLHSDPKPLAMKFAGHEAKPLCGP